MQLDYLAVIVATLAQFVVGGIWYMVPFGKAWGKIHGFEKYSKEEQQKMMKDIMPFYGLQLLVTAVTTVVLAILLRNSDGNAYSLVFHLWLGFVVPTQVSAVIFGGTEGKWIVPKIAIMAGGSLACLMVGAAVLQLF